MTSAPWGVAGKGGKLAGARQYKETYGKRTRAQHPAASVVRRGEAGLRPAKAAAAQVS